MAKKRKATKPAKDTKLAKPRGRPRQQELPGTEDRAIAPLEDAAAEYAAIRDQRMALNAEEVGLKAKLLRLMKKYGKQTYHRNGIAIEIVVEEETVKVKIKKAGDDEDANEEESAAEASDGVVDETAEA